MNKRKKFYFTFQGIESLDMSTKYIEVEARHLSVRLLHRVYELKGLLNSKIF
jgi:hypothetical protein